MLINPDQYKESFKRFEGDKLNGWNDAKIPYCGKMGKVIKTFPDLTVTIQFENGKEYDFPNESVENQSGVTVS